MLNATAGIETNAETGFEMAKDVIARRNQDGTVIVMKMDESSLFYKIDGIAAAVWNELVTRKTLGELERKFLELFPENRAELERDIRGFLEILLEKRLLVRS